MRKIFVPKFVAGFVLVTGLKVGRFAGRFLIAALFFFEEVLPFEPLGASFGRRAFPFDFLTFEPFNFPTFNFLRW